MCLCVCVYISAGKGRAGPTVHVSTAKSSTLLIQPSRYVVVFFTVHVCVRLKNFCRKVVTVYCEARQKSVWRYFQPNRNIDKFFLCPCHVDFIRLCLQIFRSVSNIQPLSPSILSSLSPCRTNVIG